MTISTVNLPVELFNEIVKVLGAQPTNSEVFPLWSKLQAHMLTTIHQAVARGTEEDVPKAPRKIVTLSKPKGPVVGEPKLSPIAMAREYIKDYPEAKVENVKAFLITKNVPFKTAASTAYKIFRKN